MRVTLKKPPRHSKFKVMGPATPARIKTYLAAIKGLITKRSAKMQWVRKRHCRGD